MNLQVIVSPRGDILWVSGPLPGSVHDNKAEWIWGVVAKLEAAGLIVVADKGYQGSAHAKVPYKGKNKPQSQKDANKAHAQLRSPGERANAQLKTWISSGSCAAAPARRAARQGHPRFCRSARQSPDEKGSLSLVSAWPALALVGSYELLMLLIRPEHQGNAEYTTVAETDHLPLPRMGAEPEVRSLEQTVRERHCTGRTQRAIARELNIDRRKVKQIIERDAA